jgi:hypothetical protein
MADEPKDQPPTPEILGELRTIVAKAKGGDESVLPRLRQLLDAHPRIWQTYGDLGAQAEMAWVAMIAGKNLHLRECLVRKIAAMKDDLAAASASPLEQLVIGRVVVCWLQLQHADCLEAQAGGESIHLATFKMKRQQAAHRWYLGAIGALMAYRKLLPGPAPRPALNSTTATPKPASSNGSAPDRENGHAPNAKTGKGKRSTGEFDLHNRITDVLQDCLGPEQDGQKPELCGAGKEK